MSDMSEVKKFMRLPAVLEATGKCRASIYNAIKAGTFPKQFAIGLNSVAWDSAEIKAWQQGQIDAARHTTDQKTIE